MQNKLYLVISPLISFLGKITSHFIAHSGIRSTIGRGNAQSTEWESDALTNQATMAGPIIS